MWSNNVGDEGAKALANGSNAIGLFLGLGVAYLTGVAALTPVSAVAVFFAAAAIGALVGYGIGKFCEKVGKEKQNDPDMSTYVAVKSALSDIFTLSTPQLKAY